MTKLHRMEDLGALVRARRRALRLSQTALAQKLGTSQDWVSRLEAGKPTLQIGLVLRALRELGVSLSADVLQNETSHTDDRLPARTSTTTSAKRAPIKLKDIVGG